MINKIMKQTPEELHKKITELTMKLEIATKALEFYLSGWEPDIDGESRQYTNPPIYSDDGETAAIALEEIKELNENNKTEKKTK